MLIIGLLLQGEVRALTAANPSCPARRGPAHGADCPKDACRMVVQGRDSLQHVPKLLFMNIRVSGKNLIYLTGCEFC
jgi:hypothetical protein